MAEFEQNSNIEHSDQASGGKITLKISLKLKIFDYILAAISGLEFAWQLFKKLSGNSTREWIWVFIPLFLVLGLLQHKKTYRIICSILLFGSILLPFILLGM
jgi:hypothetical protein